MKKDFYYKSSNNWNDVHATEWKPEGEIKAVVQIVHGMTEHIERYSSFAEYLNAHGFLVVGNDHLGHGLTTVEKEEKGYFGKDGINYLLSDIHTLRTMYQEKYPNVPYLFLGHSMGSFLTRIYLSQHGEGIEAAIIMGTGHMPAPVLASGRELCKAISHTNGWHHRSKFVTVTAFGTYLKKIEAPNTISDWISRNPEVVKAYRADANCRFTFTLNGYDTLFAMIQKAQEKETISNTPKGLPLLFTSGLMDPVGNYGKGVKKVAAKYKEAGFDVSEKYYENDRHEILNELDKDGVYEDLLNWLELELINE